MRRRVSLSIQMDDPNQKRFMDILAQQKYKTEFVVSCVLACVEGGNHMVTSWLPCETKKTENVEKEEENSLISQETMNLLDEW